MKNWRAVQNNENCVFNHANCLLQTMQSVYQTFTLTNNQVDEQHFRHGYNRATWGTSCVDLQLEHSVLRPLEAPLTGSLPLWAFPWEHKKTRRVAVNVSFTPLRLAFTESIQRLAGTGKQIDDWTSGCRITVQWNICCETERCAEYFNTEASKVQESNLFEYTMFKVNWDFQKGLYVLH